MCVKEKKNMWTVFLPMAASSPPPTPPETPPQKYETHHGESLDTIMCHLSPMNMRPSVAVIIPGFGEPYIDKKWSWLVNNMGYITRAFSSVCVFVSVYSPSAYHFFSDDTLPYDPHTTWCVRKGPSLLGRFFREDMTPSLIQRLDPSCVVALLDDVEILSSTRLDLLYSTLIWEDLHMISPTLDRRSVSCHKFMFSLWKDRPTTRHTNFIELFLYMFSPRGYTLWHSLLEPWSDFLWGIDMILSRHQMRLGIRDDMRILHHICSKQEKSPHYAKMQKELARYTKKYDHIGFKFKNTWVCHYTDFLSQTLVTKHHDCNPNYSRLARSVAHHG